MNLKARAVHRCVKRRRLLKLLFRDKDDQKVYDRSIVEFFSLTFEESISELSELLRVAQEDIAKIRMIDFKSQRRETMSTGLKLLEVDHFLSTPDALDIVIVENKEVPGIYAELKSGEKRLITQSHISPLLCFEKTYQSIRDLQWSFRQYEHSMRCLMAARLVSQFARMFPFGAKALPTKHASPILAETTVTEMFWQPWIGQLGDELDLPTLDDGQLKKVAEAMNRAPFGSADCEYRAVGAFHSWLSERTLVELDGFGLSADQVCELFGASRNGYGPNLEVKLIYSPESRWFEPRIPISDHGHDGGYNLSTTQIPTGIISKFLADSSDLTKEDMMRLVVRAYKYKCGELVSDAYEHDFCS